LAVLMSNSRNPTPTALIALPALIVDHQIDDHLLQLDAISVYGRQRLGELRLQRDTLSAT